MVGSVEGVVDGVVELGGLLLWVGGLRGWFVDVG